MQNSFKRQSAKTFLSNVLYAISVFIRSTRFPLRLSTIKEKQRNDIRNLANRISFKIHRLETTMGEVRQQKATSNIPYTIAIFIDFPIF